MENSNTLDKDLDDFCEELFENVKHLKNTVESLEEKIIELFFYPKIFKATPDFENGYIILTQKGMDAIDAMINLKK